MRHKGNDFSKGKWILIKRYPECIEICPLCENVSYTKFYESEAFKKSVNEVGYYILYTPIFQCYRCGFKMSGSMFRGYTGEFQDFIENYLKKENANYDDFLIELSKFCEQFRKDRYIIDNWLKK